MFRNRWPLFRVQGIQISVDASWLVILALMTWTLADFFHAEIGGLEGTAYWFMGFVTAITFFACILLHELGHALTAQHLGIPMRGITLFMFGGVAELDREPPSAAKEFWMAVAGPAVSAVLAGCFGLLTWFGGRNGWNPPLVVVCDYLAWINLSVLLFNLIPAFPLDGGRVFRSFLWAVMGNLRRATYWSALVGRLFAWALILVGILNFFAGNLVGGLWLGLIGMFLHSAAQSSYQQVVIRQMLHGEPVSRFMNPAPVIVPPYVNLRHWVDDYVYRYHHKTYPVASNGHLEGMISTRALADIPREEWERHTVGEMMQQDLQAITLPPDADAMQALERMQRTGSSRLLITDGDRLVGIVSLKDLLRFLHLKLELEDQGNDAELSTLEVNETRDETLAGR